METAFIDQLNEKFAKATPEEVITYFASAYKNKIALSSSLGAEDQVLTHMLTKIDKDLKIFTLDTGRLFPETYDLVAETNKHFGLSVNVYFPNFEDVENMVKNRGINLFYNSIEERKMCCRIRKIEPLKRAFKGLEVWICGLRKDQSITRFYSKMVEWDAENGLIKINPLINWTENQVWEYIHNHNIPYNVLHDKGYPSIGCQPCTRAIEKGEDIRAGRWWWEEPEQKECGLHKR